MTAVSFPPPERRLLDDGRRLHLHHGPIDLIIEAFGPMVEVRKAYAAADDRFQSVLGELVAELPALRGDVDNLSEPLRGPVARRMAAAVGRFDADFVTPMAAVAGAVADEILHVMCGAAELDKAYVNNGGDIALYLTPGTNIHVGLLPQAVASRPNLDIYGRVEIGPEIGIGGIATSGAGGRSFSLGIADAVTVLAADAAMADTAATLIANAVDVDCDTIERLPACDLDPDSDLGNRRVTVMVGVLSPAEIGCALDRGAAAAGRLLDAGLIPAACLALRSDVRVVGDELLAYAVEKRLPDEILS